MNQSRKYLKIASFLVLLFAGLTLLTLASELMFGELNNAEIPEGSPENILLITKIVILVISFLLLLPQIYVGIKGLRVAKHPNSSKGHIVWAIILFAITVMSMISPLKAIISGGSFKDNISNILGPLVEVTIYFDYIKYAIAVAREN